ncbi:MAG: TIGR04372 family glycosyltransferase [Desulfomonile tiedjei]|nr:TIGR04372 family glycosyltransferase [Desulfomonile tiedjei]
MDRPTLSVILPNYNHAQFLPTALDAMLEQSHPPTEILVIDDCSTDNSLEILTEYAEKYPTIKVFRNQQNRGVIYNLNVLSNIACGEFLYSAASDDIVMPGLFQKSVEMLCRYPQAAFCSALCLEIDDKERSHGVVDTPGVPQEPGYIAPEQAMSILENLLLEHSLHWFHAPTVVQRRESRLQEGDLDQKLRHACDGFLYQVMALKHGCCFIPEPLAKWRKMATAYSVVGETDVSIRSQIVERAKMLMVCNYPGLFPSDYVKNWEKKHLYNLQKFALVDLNQSNRRFLANIGRTRYKPTVVGSLLLRLFSLGKRIESGILAVAVSASLVRSSFLRSVLRSDFRSNMWRKWKRLKLLTVEAWTEFVRQSREMGRDIRVEKRPIPGLSSLTIAIGTILGIALASGLRVAGLFVLIRIGRIDAGNPGEMAAFSEMYLCQRELRLTRSRTRFEFFYYDRQVTNPQIFEMCKRALGQVYPGMAYVAAANQNLPGARRHLLEPLDMTDSYLKLGATEPHLRFTPAEEDQGVARLRELGVPDNAPFICVHAGSLKEATGSGQSAPASDFLPTMEEMARRGYRVVWVSDDDRKKDLIIQNPMIVNYSGDKRSDFMDIFLPAKCRFFVGSWSEFAGVATTFRRPVVHLNWIPNSRSSFYGCADLFIFPKIRLSDQIGFMGFEDSIGVFESLDQKKPGDTEKEDWPLQSGDVDLTPADDQQPMMPEMDWNSPEEILAVVVEMEERLNGAWKSTDGDEAIQRALQTMLKTKNTAFARLGMRAGADFLRQFEASMVLSGLYRSPSH